MHARAVAVRCGLAVTAAALVCYYGYNAVDERPMLRFWLNATDPLALCNDGTSGR